MCLDPAPIEVVPDIEDVVDAPDPCPEIHLSGHTLLSTIVNAFYEHPVVRVSGHWGLTRIIADPTPVADDKDMRRVLGVR